MIEKTEKIRRYRSNSITEEDKTEWFLIKIYKDRDIFEKQITWFNKRVCYMVIQ